jgi:pSer/pThr/pTyr-binding forkhead associated (FHA) protein
MAYLRVSFNNQEIERRDLAKSLVIGRSPQCDLAIRDILLSRMHCRIEQADAAWNTSDLNSKNGTSLNGQPLTSPHLLAEGDVLRLGRVKVLFSQGSLADAGLTPLQNPPWRPADPSEALSNSGTFVGVGLSDVVEQVSKPVPLENRPNPRPEPPIPEAYAREDVYSLLATIASSSWDSIYAEARRPRPEMDIQSHPRKPSPGPRPRPRSPIDLSPLVRTTIADVPAPPTGGRLLQRGLWLAGMSIVLLLSWFIQPQTPPSAQVLHPPTVSAVRAPSPLPNTSVAAFEAAAAVLPMVL